VFEYFTKYGVESDAANFVTMICGQLYYVHTALCHPVHYNYTNVCIKVADIFLV
jgi:hypothetical protein